MSTPPPDRSWSVILLAAAILLLTMGSRQSMGLFVLPINIDAGVSIVGISFALAVGQFLWGAAFTSHSWRRIYPVRSRCVVCQPRSRQRRSR